MKQNQSQAPFDGQYVTPEQVAQFVGVTVGTLANWRHEGRGPQFAKMGRAVRYLTTDVLDWVDERATGAATSKARKKRDEDEEGSS